MVRTSTFIQSGVIATIALSVRVAPTLAAPVPRDSYELTTREAIDLYSRGGPPSQLPGPHTGNGAALSDTSFTFPTVNGHTSNGHTGDGYTGNGYTGNGHTNNGLTSNGHTSNGHTGNDAAAHNSMFAFAAANGHNNPLPLWAHPGNALAHSGSSLTTPSDDSFTFPTANANGHSNHLGSLAGNGPTHSDNSLAPQSPHPAGSQLPQGHGPPHQAWHEYSQINA